MREKLVRMCVAVNWSQPPIYMDIMLERWQQYPPLSRNFKITLAIIMSVTLAIGFVGNTLVLILFYKYRSLRTTSNTFVINLTVADLLMCICCIPFLIVNSIHDHCMEPFRIFLCNADGTIGALSGFMSILSLTAVATDRCVVISRTRPILYPTDKKVAYLALVAIWIFSAMFASVPMLGFGNYVLEGSMMSCTFDFFTRSTVNIAYNITIELLFFGIPLIIIIVCYLIICIRVRAHEVKYFRQRNKPSFDAIMLRHMTKDRKLVKNEIKTARSAIILILVFCLSWLPYSVISLVALFGDNSWISPMVVTFPSLFAKLSTIMNPVLYAFLNARFRKKMRLFCFGCVSAQYEGPSSDHGQGYYTPIRNNRNSFALKPQSVSGSNPSNEEYDL